MSYAYLPPYLVKCLFKSFGNFNLVLFVFFLLGFEGSLYILNINPSHQLYILQISFPSLWLDSFFFFNNVFQRAEVFHFNEVQFSLFSFIDHAFGITSKKFI